MMRLSLLIVLLTALACSHSGLCAVTSAVDLQKRFEDIARSAKGKVGVAVELLETGERIAMNGQLRFPMQSVYKFPIAMAVLERVEQGTLTLQQPVRVTTNDFVTPGQHSPIRDLHPSGTELTVSNLLRYMVSESDGSACDVLLGLLGGSAAVDRYLQNLGVTNVVVANTEKEIGQDEFVQYRNWAAPKGITQLLRILHDGDALSVSRRKLLLQFMTDTSTGLRRIKGLLPPGTVVAHKTGSSRMVNHLTAATNDAGIITLPDGRHIVIAVFVSDSRADDAIRDAVIAKISRAAWDYWTSVSERR